MMVDTISKTTKQKKQNKFNITWTEYALLLDKLLNRINDTRIKFGNIYPIPRGGLVIAVFLSHALDKPISFELQNDSLVVDDIYDTGLTLKQYKFNYKAVLISKKRAEKLICAQYVNKSVWIVFPYEKNDTN